MTSWKGIVLVRSERVRDPLGYGGLIFSGYHVNEKGEKLTKDRIAVQCNSRLLPLKDSIQPWEFWHVKGHATEATMEINGRTIPEVRVKATSLHMVRHGGAIIVEILANSDKFKGVGITKARELWTRFGDQLYDILDTGCTTALAEVLTATKAAEVANAWQNYADGRFIAFLHQHGFPTKLSRKVVDFYGKNAGPLLAEDAYRLLAFMGSWTKTDRLAQRVYGIAVDSKVRLKAAIEEALFRLLKDKSTAVGIDFLRDKLSQVLKAPRNDQATRQLVDKALSLGESNGAYVVRPDGLYQAVGPYIMERTISDRLWKFLTEPDPEPSLIMSSSTECEINRLITEFEAANGLVLNKEQREAVFTCVTNRFSIITGGAGTGKTTVLKCLYYVLNALGYGVVQMALAGKAAKRMREATGGKKSHTIAGFLAKSADIIADHGPHTYYVIDESSMLDVPTTYRIMKRLPDTIRLVMVGDPYQLPPIGPGLVFQLLVGDQTVPQVTLTEVKRQKDSTGIPTFAAEVRNQVWPNIKVPGVSFIDCEDHEILPNVLSLFTQDPDRTQVICTLNSLVDALNKSCQDVQNDAGRPIRIFGSTGELCGIRIRERDRIIFTRNDWERGVMNGDIGVVNSAFDEPFDSTDDNPIVGRALVDDVDQPIYKSDVDWDDPGLALGYAITCHKAQGSQFPRIIVPIKNSLDQDGNIKCPILDMTWFYTAVTRAEHEVILVGHKATAKRAVELGSRCSNRTVGLKFGEAI